MDFRATEAFLRGDEPMGEVERPMGTKRMGWEAMTSCNLVYSGIDLKLTPEGDFVLLEGNSVIPERDLARRQAPRPAAERVRPGPGSLNARSILSLSYEILKNTLRYQ